MLGANDGTSNGSAVSERGKSCGRSARRRAVEAEGAAPFAKPRALQHVGHYSRHLQKQPDCCNRGDGPVGLAGLIPCHGTPSRCSGKFRPAAQLPEL